jgi:hypothetical protein
MGALDGRVSARSSRPRRLRTSRARTAPAENTVAVDDVHAWLVRGRDITDSRPHQRMIMLRDAGPRHRARTSLSGRSSHQRHEIVRGASREPVALPRRLPFSFDGAIIGLGGARMEGGVANTEHKTAAPRVRVEAISAGGPQATRRFSGRPLPLANSRLDSVAAGSETRAIRDETFRSEEKD